MVLESGLLPCLVACLSTHNPSKQFSFIFDDRWSTCTRERVASSWQNSIVAEVTNTNGGIKSDVNLENKFHLNPSDAPGIPLIDFQLSGCDNY